MRQYTGQLRAVMMDKNKPIVLLFCRYFLPGRKGGGPIRQYENLIEAAGSRLDFRIVTLDRDLGDNAPYDGVPVGEWLEHGPAKVLYLPEASVDPSRVATIIDDTAPDIVYLNSFWDRCFTANFLTARKQRSWPDLPVLFAVRGGFNPAALAINRWRKRAYILWLKWSGRLANVFWHATTDLEAQILSREFGQQPGFEVLQAPDLGVAASADLGAWQPRAAGAQLRLALVSRIAPIKNIEFAIEALSHCKQPVSLHIYGPREDAQYAAECEAMAASLPAHCSVHFAGSIGGHEVVERLSEHDGFLLPTKGENFGHVIAEALAAGTPTMISERTPWLDKAAGGGCEIASLSEGPEGWAKRIDAWAMLDGEAMRALHEETLAWGAQHLQSDSQIAEQEALFLKAIEQASERA